LTPVLAIETLPAPHSRPLLPPGQSAVYVFAISEAHGRSAPCGPGTVLKVARVGPGNRRRFALSHYNPVAPTISTLAQSAVRIHQDLLEQRLVELAPDWSCEVTLSA
jgi:hypothetical protein